MKAMIFAAGTGTRLGGITGNIPKALVEINGKSILRLAVEKIASYGFTEIIVNVHHFADMVEKEIGVLAAEGFNITVSDERDLLLETGGGLYKAREFFGKEPFLMYNADILTTLDLDILFEYHVRKGGIATLAVADHGHSRVFITGENGIVCGWQNSFTGEKIISREIPGNTSLVSFSGIHIADPEIFSFMQEGIYSMTTLYLKIAGTRKIFTLRHDQDYWADIGTPEELEKARLYFSRSSRKSL
ncbi:MAG TPA: nucleotidyltransferase family protein [Bacteroidales bacterium]|nr:nucleotidyltransferase family protein [Bacteroidales bacterium]